jgi:transcriptional regulator with XRE-family HTH domain
VTGRPQLPVDANCPLHLQQLSEEMRAVREAADLTLKQLSEMTHYTESALSHATKGKRMPSKRLTLAWFEACGAPDVEAWGDIWEEFKQADVLYRRDLKAAGSSEPTPAPAAGDRDGGKAVVPSGIDRRVPGVEAPTISLQLQRAETPADLVKAIRALAARAGRPSLRKMAEVSTVKKSTIQDWLTGETRPTRLDELVIGLGASTT